MDCYDPETGQVYRERIFRPQLGEVREWEHYVPKDIRELRHFHQNGADSMTNMLMRKIACHTRSLEPQNLAAVPTLIIDKLWTAIRREYDISRLKTVTAEFADLALGTRKLFRHGKRLSTPATVLQVLSTLQQLTKSTSRWWISFWTWPAQTTLGW
jgi:hypothetical protein